MDTNFIEMASEKNWLELLTAWKSDMILYPHIGFVNKNNDFKNSTKV